MEQLDLHALVAEAAAADELALKTPDIDAFCSSTAWAVSAHEAFHPEQEPCIWRGDRGWMVLARARGPDIGRYLAPLEAMWGLASPLLSADPKRFALDCARALRAMEGTWDALWLCGLRRHSECFNGLAMGLGRTYRLFIGPTTRRHVASLEGGYEGFLSRRPRKLRKAIRQAERKAEAEGLTWEVHTAAADEVTRAALYQRALDVDDRSWKGLSEQGLSAGGMARFYDGMTARLARRGQLRIVFARLDGVDIAMGFGAAFGDTCRGLQMSYDDRYRHLSLGNLVQTQLVRLVTAEGLTWYDLGTDMGYKTRWAEPGLETVALVVRR